MGIPQGMTRRKKRKGLIMNNHPNNLNKFRAFTRRPPELQNAQQHAFSKNVLFKWSNHRNARSADGGACRQVPHKYPARHDQTQEAQGSNTNEQSGKSSEQLEQVLSPYLQNAERPKNTFSAKTFFSNGARSSHAVKNLDLSETTN